MVFARAVNLFAGGAGCQWHAVGSRRRTSLRGNAIAVTPLSSNRGSQLDGAFDRDSASISRLPPRDADVHSRSGMEAARTVEQICAAASDALPDSGNRPVARRQDGFPGAMAPVGS